MFLPVNITLKFGDSGDFVSELQRRLVAVHCFSSDAVNGFFDGTTVNGVSSFQSMSGLLADGIAGPETLRRLNGVISGDTSTNDHDADKERLRQEELHRQMQQEELARLQQQQEQERLMAEQLAAERASQAQHWQQAPQQPETHHHAHEAAAHAPQQYQQPDTQQMIAAAAAQNMQVQHQMAHAQQHVAPDMQQQAPQPVAPQPPAPQPAPQAFDAQLYQQATQAQQQQSQAQPQQYQQQQAPQQQAQVPVQQPAQPFPGQMQMPAPQPQPQQPQPIPVYQAQAAPVAQPAPVQQQPQPQYQVPAAPTQQQAQQTHQGQHAYVPVQQPQPLVPQPQPVAPQQVAMAAQQQQAAAQNLVPAAPQQMAETAVAPKGIVGRAVQYANDMVQKLSNYFESKLPTHVIAEVKDIGMNMAKNGVREAAIPTGPEQQRGPELPARGQQQQQVPNRG